MRLILLQLLLSSSQLAGDDIDLPFRIRKVDAGLSYDLVFMPIKAETNSRKLINYKVTGSVSSEILNEIAAPISSDSQVESAFQTQSGLTFRLSRTGKDANGAVFAFEPDSRANQAWVINRLQKRRLEEQRILSQYGFESMTQLKLFRSKYADLIAKLSSTPGSKDPLSEAIAQVRMERSQQKRPETVGSLLRSARDLKGEFHRTCTPIWNKGSFATWDENEQLKEAMADIAFHHEALLKLVEKRRKDLQSKALFPRLIKHKGQQIQIPILYALHPDSANTVQNQSLIEDCLKYSELLATLRMPELNKYSRDDFNMIAKVADLLFFASSSVFVYGDPNVRLTDLTGY